MGVKREWKQESHSCTLLLGICIDSRRGHVQNHTKPVADHCRISSAGAGCIARIAIAALTIATGWCLINTVVDSGRRLLRSATDRTCVRRTRSFIVAGPLVRNSLPSYLTLSPPIPLRLYTLPYWSNPPFLFFDKLKTVGQTSMALDPSNSSNLERLALKGLRQDINYEQFKRQLKTSLFEGQLITTHRGCLFICALEILTYLHSSPYCTRYVAYVELSAGSRGAGCIAAIDKP